MDVVRVCSVLVAFSFLLACRRDCEPEIRQSVKSPDGLHVATVAVENCNDSGPFTTIVNIRRVSDTFDRDDYVFAAVGSITATATWTSPNSVVIQTEEAESTRREPRWRDVSVTYQPFPPPAVAAPVPLVPSAGAREVSPGTFVATIKPGAGDGRRIQHTAAFTLHETLYDAAGREVGGSVPGTTWDRLPDSSKRRLADMRKGEVRRVWTCVRENPCTVEDVKLVTTEPVP